MVSMTSSVPCTETLRLPAQHPENDWLLVGIASQRLWHFRNRDLLADYPVSTARNGVGECSGSEQTPRGWHVVRARIGAGEPAFSVFRGRRATGETWTPALHAACPGRDWILTRILWLSGLEPGVNRGCNADGQVVDSMRRYIYLHGTPDCEPMGVPLSHGCIRLRNDDILALFDNVPAGTRVLIREDA